MRMFGPSPSDELGFQPFLFFGHRNLPRHRWPDPPPVYVRKWLLPTGTFRTLPLCGCCGIFGGKLVGVEVLFQSFPALLDNPGVSDDLVSFVLSGVAEYILLLEHFPEVCPVSYAMTYVLTDLVFFGVTVAAQEPIEERLILLGHLNLLPSLFPTLFYYRACDYSNGWLCLSRPLRPTYGSLARRDFDPSFRR